MQKLRQGEFSDLFVFSEKVWHEVKASGQPLSFSILWLFSNWPCNKNRLDKCSNWQARDCSILIFSEILRPVSAPYFVWLFKKNIFHVVFYKLTKFHCLIVFISWDIRQCTHQNCFAACDNFGSENILFWKEGNHPKY